MDKVDKRAELKAKFLDISKLHNWEKNPRSISTKGYERLKKQIQTLGMYKPLLITEDGTVLGGNMRLRAYKDLGIKDVWVSVVDAPTEEKKLEYALSDNDRAGYYDDDLLAGLTSELPDFNWGDYSVDLKEPTNLQDLLDQFKEVVEDEAPEVTDNPVSKLGEVYQLGRHRLMVGDSTKIEDVERLMDGQKADLCLTDPPYGLDEKKESGKNDYNEYKDTKDNLINLADKWLPIVRELTPVVVFSPGITNQWLYPEPNWVMCWFYGGGQLRSSWGFNCWQPFLCYGKDPSLASSNGGRPDAVDMNTPANAKELNHPCPKPMKLWEWLINRLSFSNDDVLFDPFGGSGTTLIASEQLNRTCYMMEIDPKYCDVIRKRYAKFIGKEAEWEKITPMINKE